MNEQEFDGMLERLMQQDLSAGTEAFRDALLSRCLAALDASDEFAEIEDDYLDMLAAAGNPYADMNNRVEDDRAF